MQLFQFFKFRSCVNHVKNFSKVCYFISTLSYIGSVSSVCILCKSLSFLVKSNASSFLLPSLMLIQHFFEWLHDAFSRYTSPCIFNLSRNQCKIFRFLLLISDLNIKLIQLTHYFRALHFNILKRHASKNNNVNYDDTEVSLII